MSNQDTGLSQFQAKPDVGSFELVDIKYTNDLREKKNERKHIYNASYVADKVDWVYFIDIDNERFFMLDSNIDYPFNDIPEDWIDSLVLE